MPLTIGHKHTGRRIDYAHQCDVCGVSWHRSKLKRSANGTLLCPDDWPGMVERQLDDLAHPPFGLPVLASAGSSIIVSNLARAQGAAPSSSISMAITPLVSVAPGNTLILTVAEFFGQVSAITGTETWTMVGQALAGSNWPGSDISMTVYTATASNTAPTANVVFDSGSPTPHAALACIDVVRGSTTATVVNINFSAGGTGLGSDSGLGTSSEAAWSVIALVDPSTTTAPAGWTNLTSGSAGPGFIGPTSHNIYLASAWTNDASVSRRWTFPSAVSAGVCWIKFS